MASTFSPSLKIELIGNGDKSGTWGTTTNNNLGTLIEQAIAGVQQIVMTNIDYTLSNLNGISDEARNAVIVLSGTNSAIRNIIAPAVKKTYIIKNSTTGGFAVIVKTSASTGVSIANGATQTIFCDGTEFYIASFPSTGGTITGSLAVTGDLAVTGIPSIPTATAGTSNTQAANTLFVTTALQLLYPVGAIYSSTVGTNPGTTFGFGTWVAFGAGRVLIGNGGGFTAGATGGSADAVVVSHSHNFTGNALPGHSHGYDRAGSPAPQSGSSTNCLTNPATTHPQTDVVSAGTPSGSIDYQGVSGTNANLQPYVVVYMWNRTA